jgi:hypothetical protein
MATWLRQVGLVAAGVGIGAAACGGLLHCETAEPSKVSKGSPAPVRRPIIDPLPAHLTLAQRMEAAAPGSDRVRIRIGDVTGGQVQVTLVIDGAAIVAQPMKPGATIGFSIEGSAYTLRLDGLDQKLIGDDLATFTIAAADKAASQPVAAMSEPDRIEALIAHIEGLSTAVFVRNGAAHSAADAASHLRAKWKRAGSEVATAEQFIDLIATQSSMSGEAYVIRLADGTEAPAGAYLHARLREMEGR